MLVEGEGLKALCHWRLGHYWSLATIPELKEKNKGNCNRDNSVYVGPV